MSNPSCRERRLGSFAASAEKCIEDFKNSDDTPPEHIGVPNLFGLAPLDEPKSPQQVGDSPPQNIFQSHRNQAFFANESTFHKPLGLDKSLRLL